MTWNWWLDEGEIPLGDPRVLGEEGLIGDILWGRWGGGWLTVDAAAITVTATRATTYKVDATVGVSPSDRWKAILQVQTSTVPGLSFDAKLAPSVVRRFGDHVWGELGLTHTLTGPQQYGLKFGVWLEF